MNLNKTQIKHSQIVIDQMLNFTQPADAVLSHYFKNNRELGSLDRHAIAETTFSALRHYEKIQDFLQKRSSNAHLVTLCTLVLGQEMSVGSLSELINEEETALLSELKGKKSHFQSQLNTASELPQWIIEKLPHLTEAQITSLGKSLCKSAPLDLRVNTQKGKRDKVLAQLQAEGIEAVATPFSPWGIRLAKKIALNKHPLFLDGTLEVQDEGSQLLALLTGAKRGEMIVDFCAGAGGKTLALGSMMANTGRLYAFDIAAKRLNNLKPRLARSMLSNVHPELIDNESDPRIKRLNNKVDRVLVDAPCSGLGTLRRNPDLKYRQSPKRLENIVLQQQNILVAASKLVRQGGRLVYATCSILPEENQAQVDLFLQSNPEFTIVPVNQLLAEQKIDLDTGIYLELTPENQQTDGFFACVLQKQ